jgi:hypothetical protein
MIDNAIEEIATCRKMWKDAALLTLLKYDVHVKIQSAPQRKQHVSFRKINWLMQFK